MQSYAKFNKCSVSVMLIATVVVNFTLGTPCPDCFNPLFSTHQLRYMTSSVRRINRKITFLNFTGYPSTVNSYIYSILVKEILIFPMTRQIDDKPVFP